MTVIVIVFVILLVISFVLAFLLFGKEQVDSKRVDKPSLVDDPAILFDSKEEETSGISQEEIDEEII